MSNATHTPGPWEVITMDDGRPGVSAKTSCGHVSRIVTCEHDAHYLHDDDSPCHSRFEILPAVAEANAHLIAAAPDLLEALADYTDAKQRFIYGIEHCERTSETITLRMLAALVVASDDLVCDKARMLHWLADQVN